MALKRPQISTEEARRIALTAQGFGRPRTGGRVDTRHFRSVLRRLNVVQLDSVNVLARAHYLPFFARLGPYSRDALDRWLWRSGEAFEYWAHEASLTPIEHRVLLGHRMRDASHWARLRRWAADEGARVAQVLDRVSEVGPVSVGDFDDPARGGWWGWSDTKRALEYLFLIGQVTVRDRINFSRRYDLPERVQVLATPRVDADEARLELLALSAAALGVGTVHDLADYFRLPLSAAKALVPRLVQRGDVEAVHVEGWREPAYLHRDAALPRRIHARALLAPFDPVVWHRDRTERLFGFRYRIEIYTPAPQRVYGYYVLPFLLNDRFVARVDLKADRSARRLLVRTAHLEEDAVPGAVAAELASELASMAAWLELEEVSMQAPGALGDALRAAR